VDAPPHRTGVIYLDGYWESDPQDLRLVHGPGRITLPYQAQEVYAVMSAEGPQELEVLLDGKPPLKSQVHQDVVFRDGRAYLTVDRDDMYYIIRTGQFEKHELTLVCKGDSLKVYAYTFG
jgi:hypothetical protein